MRSVLHALIVALIGMVVGSLFVGGIFKIREAAARIQCANNLRQLGLSMQNYCDTYERGFPQAAMLSHDLPPEKRLSWLVEILPFVESNTIYPKIIKSQAWDSEENRFAALLRLKLFQCPAYPERQPDSVFAATHYVGIAGIGTDAISIPLDDSRAGLFGYSRRVRLSDIHGGASMLIAVMETSEASGSWTAAGAPTVRGLDPSGPHYLGVSGQFGGTHRGGANVLSADASVRFLKESIQPELLEALVSLKSGSKSWPVEDQ